MNLYCDGGVISKNPSFIGGTWAWCIVENDQIISNDAGMITPKEMGTLYVTNNQTEMLALVRGLLALPDGFCGKVCSDSQVTLGRAFHGYKWENIPDWLRNLFYAQSHRIHLLNRKEVQDILLAGHPTKAQLKVGIGRHNLPVSEYNVWCDKACQHVANSVLNGSWIQREPDEVSVS